VKKETEERKKGGGAVIKKRWRWHEEKQSRKIIAAQNLRPVFKKGARQK
jgi:hypothetical protein